MAERRFITSGASLRGFFSGARVWQRVQVGYSSMMRARTTYLDAAPSRLWSGATLIYVN